MNEQTNDLKKDDQGRPLVNSPEEALRLLLDGYDFYRLHATLSFSVSRKRQQLTGIEHTLSECERAVAATKKAGKGRLASEWRKVTEFVRAQSHEVRMWLFLNDGEMHSAWEELMEAQGASHWAARWLPDFEPAQHLEGRLEEIERVIFPKQHYFSPSLIIDQSDVECTICHDRGGACEHIAGDIYDGEVAGNVIHNITGVREISIVDDPANKRARALYYEGIDLLTGEEYAGSPEPSHQDG
jgi:hypothetical protein